MSQKLCHLVVLDLLICVTGCSGAQLHRCPAEFLDSSVKKCSGSLDDSGKFRMCEEPKDLYRCELAQ